jgi:spore coat polysaccharide biosynthesis predicted glycosyltransferase SpsG
VRCLTLAEEMVARGWRVSLATKDLPDPLARRAASIGVAIADVDAVFGDADAIVLDSYALDSAYRARVRAEGRPVLTLDDGPGTAPLHANLVLNPARAAQSEDYSAIAPGALLLLGPRYALIRKEIRDAARRAETEAGKRSRLLVIFGGSDPRRLTGPVAAALRRRLPDVQITAVVGALAEARSGPPGIEWFRDPPDLAQLIAESGLAVSAAGGTLGELAVCGVPTVATVVADNQLAAATTMPGWGIAIDARKDDAVSALADHAASLWQKPALRTRMGRAAREDVDGEGVVRVVDALAARIAQCAR